MIIFRYFAREVYAAVFSVTLVLVAILLINQTIRFLSEAASGDIATTAVFSLISLELPYLLGLLLPIGLFFGILIAYGRFYADHEMTVLFAAGLGRWQLLKITVGISVVIFFLVSLLMFGLNPYLASQKNKILESATVSNLVASLIPGDFKTSSGGSKVIYVGGVTTDHKKAEDIFIAEQPGSSKSQYASRNGWTITSASRGYEQQSDDPSKNYIIAEKGYRYQGVPGQKNFTVTKFEKYGVMLPDDHGKVLSRHDTDAMTTKYLIQHYSKDLRYQVEMQWRMTLPISALLFGVLAMLLSKVGPRQGRFQRFIPAVLIYVAYVNLVFVAKDWMSHGTTPAWLGMWWVHVVLFVFISAVAMGQRWR